MCWKSEEFMTQLCFYPNFSGFMDPQHFGTALLKDLIFMEVTDHLCLVFTKGHEKTFGTLKAQNICRIVLPQIEWGKLMDKS